MKRILTALAILGAMTTSAMAVDFSIVKARVPFDFTVSGVQLPAGAYQVERHGPGNVLAIRDASGQVKVTFQTNPLYAYKRTQQPAFVFNKYGDQHFLSRVWTGSPTTGRELRKTKVERELIASAPLEQVFVAAIYR